MRQVIVKNNGSEDWILKDTKPQIMIAAGSSEDLLERLSFGAMLSSNQLYIDLANEDLSLVVNNGTADLTMQQGIDYITPAFLQD